jgi:hypothetical protein
VLPDGLFSNQKSQFWGKFWKVCQWEMLVFLCPFCILCGQMVYFMSFWYILWRFGIFSPFWYVVPRKIWQPWQDPPVHERLLVREDVLRQLNAVHLLFAGAQARLLKAPVIYEALLPKFV